MAARIFPILRDELVTSAIIIVCGSSFRFKQSQFHAGIPDAVLVHGRRDEIGLDLQVV